MTIEDFKKTAEDHYLNLVGEGNDGSRLIYTKEKFINMIAGLLYIVNTEYTPKANVEQEDD